MNPAGKMGNCKTGKLKNWKLELPSPLDNLYWLCIVFVAVIQAILTIPPDLYRDLAHVFLMEIEFVYFLKGFTKKVFGNSTTYPYVYADIFQQILVPSPSK